ncbi:MAG: DUF3299 domain-containing protein [Opitutae bacterium]|nr:DUF3299 domain-containing protein [Opitutae bacterium]
MKTPITPLAFLALISLLFSCEQEPKTQASAGPPPVGEPIEVDSWKIVSSELREFPKQTDIGYFTGGFNAVLGPRGSQIDLILNAMFHMGPSAGLLSWEQYEQIRDTRGVNEAYPIAVGDNYKGYRLVGTLPELLEEHEWNKGKKYEVKEGGRIFSENENEALVGDYVAQQLGLSIGDEFHPYHGLSFDEKKQHQDTFVVVGLLESTGTPSDNVIWVPIKGIQQMEGHVPAAAQSVSAVLLSLSGRTGFTLDMKYNKEGNEATLAWPVDAVMSSFFDRSLPGYLRLARQLQETGVLRDPKLIDSGPIPSLLPSPVVVEEGLVVKGKATRTLPPADPPPAQTEPSEKLPPLKDGSAFRPLAFRDMTNFEYLVDWETDGKDFDFSAYSKRVPSRLREKSGAKVAVEGFMIPTVVDENNKVKEFLLLPDQMSCCFGKSPEANGWVVVTASNGVEVLMDRIIRVTGTLTVEERWDEEFFVGLYHMDCKDVTGPAL